MSRSFPVLALALALLPACERVRALLPDGGGADGHAGHAPADERAAVAGDVAYYTCPMHPSIKQPGPGKCPLCGMDLTPVTKAELESGAVVVDAGRRERLGIRVEPAEVRPLRSTLSLPAVVAWDQARLVDVALKVEGWIEDLEVPAAGAHVKAGQTLFTLYSPDVVATQQDLIDATGQAKAGVPGAQSRADAARRRLDRWDVPDAIAERALADGKPVERIPVVAPAGGWVLEKTAVEGAVAPAGQTLYRIGDLSRVWLDVSVPESHVGRLRPGQAVTVRVPGADAPRTGEVTLIYPGMAAATRTARVRVELPNPDGALRPDQWATVEIELDAGERLAVPEEAVVYTGPRRVVFVDADEDRLVPREVRTGVSADGWVEIVEGLQAGERVVTSGNFLVAADSRLRAGGEATAHDGHGGGGTGADGAPGGGGTGADGAPGSGGAHGGGH